jgi:hypothetical protein
MFVPRGWWHCVLNVEDTVAVTQNYVSDCNLADVLQFLRIKGEQVSFETSDQQPTSPTYFAGFRLQPRASSTPDVCGCVERAATGQGKPL